MTLKDRCFDWKTKFTMGTNHISDVLVSHEYMTMEQQQHQQQYQQQHQMHQHQLNVSITSENPLSPIDLQEGSSRPIRRTSQRTTQHPTMCNEDQLERIYEGLRVEYRLFIKGSEFQTFEELMGLTDEYELLKSEEARQTRKSAYCLSTPDEGYDAKNTC
ncbi:uncharacterized protein LOC118753271 [Rhagoletis pomonella]|uniref:uncharacterized protein LOC118753271 n=1 Tax=Rhagoletis pomonella TaxID=28610 RepID=UPI00177E7A38|nr:uncharacterized protein LOC118753271 [Rhagoletis pomonella]